MTKSRVFVSHSSKDRQVTRELCEALRGTDVAPTGYESVVDYDVLPDYDVLVDIDELQAGKPWPKQLHEWMARCHAAVILLTESAVTSPWVLKEATILSWRLSVDPTFSLFTVRFPQVTPELLSREKFDPLMLGQIQSITSFDAPGIAEQIRKAIPIPKPLTTPFEALVSRLTDLLSKVGDGTLKSVVEKARSVIPAWRPGGDLRAQMVEELARELLCESLGGYATDGIQRLISDLGATTSAETLKDILRMIAPQWVDLEAAGRLPALLADRERRAAALNGTFVSSYTANMYVRRAHMLNPFEHQVIETAGGTAGNFLEHYTEEICSRLRSRMQFANKKNEEIVWAMLGRRATDYVLLPPPIPDDESLAALLARFPTLAFILWTGERLDRSQVLQGVDWLTPELDLNREDAEYQNWCDALEVIKQKQRD